MLVSLQNVCWGDAGQSILKNVSMGIAPKEIVTIIGPNGAGKSTLLKLITGLLSPTSGSVTRQKGLRVGYMPQRLNTDRSLPITTQRFLELTSAPPKAYIHAAEQLNISRILATPLQALSGGELQRVLLARAILMAPDLLVLDEPTQGVDVGGQVALYRLIVELRDSLGCAVAMVSHDLHLVMAQTDSVICLNQHICCHGSPESVEQHPEYLQLFGKQAAKDIAVYTHHHDHQHDLHGDVISHSCNHHHD